MENPEWCLMLLDTQTHDEPTCNAMVRGDIVNIASCAQCAYSIEYKLENLSQDTKNYLELNQCIIKHF